jgi:hypothetical protein
MKKLILAVTLALGSGSGLAGFLPITSCSNAYADISILINPNMNSTVTVLTTKQPTSEYQAFDLRELKLTETLLQTMPTQTKGRSSTTVTFKEIILGKADGSKMPDAYSQSSAEDGTLVDYFTCSTAQVYWPYS